MAAIIFILGSFSGLVVGIALYRIFNEESEFVRFNRGVCPRCGVRLKLEWVDAETKARNYRCSNDGYFVRVHKNWVDYK